MAFTPPNVINIIQIRLKNINKGIDHNFNFSDVNHKDLIEGENVYYHLVEREKYDIQCGKKEKKWNDLISLKFFFSSKETR